MLELSTRLINIFFINWHELDYDKRRKNNKRIMAKIIVEANLTKLWYLLAFFLFLFAGWPELAASLTNMGKARGCCTNTVLINE